MVPINSMPRSDTRSRLSRKKALVLWMAASLGAWVLLIVTLMWLI